jgi:hypothetical protein
MPGELVIHEQMSPLPRIGAGGVEADQWNAAAVFLEVDAVDLSIDFDVDVAPDDRLRRSRS